VRVTWIQPEDLIGHELRQAREEGKDVEPVEARWLGAGGAPAPPRGASQEPATPKLRRLASALLDELGRLDRPLASAEPDELEAILAAAPGAAALPVADDVTGRIRGAWLGRAVGCLLGKPVEAVPRAGIRAIAEGTGNWPVAGYFTAVGLDDEIARRWPLNKASRPTSLVENIDGMPEDDDLNFTMLALALLERCGPSFSSLDVARIWLDLLPPGRIFTAERIAMRNLLLARLPPETATHHNPFREWIGARLRVDAYGWAAPGDPERAARMAWADARVSHTTNGAYAAMFMAAAHAATMCDVSAAEAATVGLGFVPAGSRLADALRFAQEQATASAEWEEVVDALYLRYGSLHWVHAINNTALVAAAMFRFTSFDEAICGVVAGGWDTDTNGAAIGSVFGALAGPEGIGGRWSAPLKDTVASSLPGFDRSSLGGLAARSLAVVSDAARA
jgi:ADP-ribosylglycohydrolase